jgi:hypothetical protein
MRVVLGVLLVSLVCGIVLRRQSLMTMRFLAFAFAVAASVGYYFFRMY